VRALAVLLLVSGSLASTAPGAPAKSSSGFFKTPSGKIFCQWSTGGSPSASVDCGVTTGLKPKLPKTGSGCRHLDYVGNRITLSATGRAQPVPCAGDAGPFADPGRSVLLRYGKTWSAGGVACTEKASGLTCKNRSGHGFFMSLRSWRVF
jgi:hypothetical protein